MDFEDMDLKRLGVLEKMEDWLDRFNWKSIWISIAVAFLLLFFFCGYMGHRLHTSLMGTVMQTINDTQTNIDRAHQRLDHIDKVARAESEKVDAAFDKLFDHTDETLDHWRMEE